MTAPDPERVAAVPRLLLGVATGLLLGLLLSLSPIAAVVAVAVVLGITIISVVRRGDSSRTLLLAGTLVGVGIFSLYAVVNTTTSCIDTDDFCGNANIWPLSAMAVITIAVGAVAAAIVARRRAQG